MHSCMSRSRSQRSKLRRKYKNVLDPFRGESGGPLLPLPRGSGTGHCGHGGNRQQDGQARVFGRGFFDTPQIREQMAVAAEKGWLRIYILYLEEKPAAFWRGTDLRPAVCRGTMRAMIPFGASFHPGFFSFSISSRTSARTTSRALILAMETRSSNSVLATLRRVESRLHIYAPTLRGILLNLLNTTTPFAINCAKFLLQRAHCLEWARRVSRNQLAYELRKQSSIAVK